MAVTLSTGAGGAGPGPHEVFAAVGSEMRVRAGLTCQGAVSGLLELSWAERVLLCLCFAVLGQGRKRVI